MADGFHFHGMSAMGRKRALGASSQVKGRSPVNDVEEAKYGDHKDDPVRPLDLALPPALTRHEPSSSAHESGAPALHTSCGR